MDSRSRFKGGLVWRTARRQPQPAPGAVSLADFGLVFGVGLVDGERAKVRKRGRVSHVERCHALEDRAVVDPAAFRYAPGDVEDGCRRVLFGGVEPRLARGLGRTVAL